MSKFVDVGLLPRIVVVDGGEAMVRLENGGREMNSIWSRDPVFVNMVDSYMKSLWEKAEEVDLRSLPSVQTYGNGYRK